MFHLSVSSMKFSAMSWMFRSVTYSICNGSPAARWSNGRISFFMFWILLCISCMLYSKESIFPTLGRAVSNFSAFGKNGFQPVRFRKYGFQPVHFGKNRFQHLHFWENGFQPVHFRKYRFQHLHFQKDRFRIF